MLSSRRDVNMHPPAQIYETFCLRPHAVRVFFIFFISHSRCVCRYLFLLPPSDRLSCLALVLFFFNALCIILDLALFFHAMHDKAIL